MVKLLEYLLGFYLIVVLFFLLAEYFHDANQELKSMIKNAFHNTNNFIKNSLKDFLKNDGRSVPVVKYPEVPPILANELFESVGVRFASYSYLAEMNFSSVNTTNGFYQFSFRIINGNLKQTASFIKDITAETVEDYLFASGSATVDVIVKLHRLTPTISQVVVSCADTPESYSALQNYKRRLANISLKRKIDSTNSAVDEELNRDLNDMKD